ncbi:integrin alpha-3-like [Diretmus argenteus]
MCVCVSVCVRAFNLDTVYPVLKRGSTGSLFGLSVALHQHTYTDRFLLLVGAPKERAEPDIAANQTGGVYSCPITTDQSDCSRMNVIDKDLDESEDLVEDMWLGVSVASQGQPGGRALVCGHRFVKIYGAFRLRHMIGKCYLGSNMQHEPDAMRWQSPEQACSHLLEFSSEVLCNMGISTAITHTEAIVGSPGSYEWQGYSVAQAPRLLSQDAVTIVTGAPKDSKEDGRGSVMLAVRKLPSNSLTVQLTLRGEQTGSYYGNAVAVTDLDNNGWNDLLVGAPFYFHRQQEEGGAVYVYLNAGGRLGPRPSLVLRGPAGSAFGMALAAAGDLNQDGFQDFAVGAPFHGTGSVMIWTGSAEGISTKPSQVIEGRHISGRFRTFGFSLSGGLDVDGNQYPDLLVGSLDDTVALLRTRPVIHLNKTLRVTPELIDPNSCDYCTGAQSYRENIIRDKVEPLVFSLNVSLLEKPAKNKRSLQKLDRFPILSQIPKPSRTQVHIIKDCGDDNRCQSNLQMTAWFANQEGKVPFLIIKKMSLVVEVTNHPLPGRRAEDAHSAALNVSIPSSLKYSGVRSEGDSLVVKCSADDQVLLCDLGNPFKSKQKVTVEIIFETSEISLDTREIHSVLQLSTLSEQSDLSPVSLSILVEYSLQTAFTLIKQPGHAQFSGHVIGESAVKRPSDIGSPLLFAFQVEVIGKPLGDLGNLEVEITWPWEASNGKWLLYLTDIRLDGTLESRCIPPGNIVNPLNVTDCVHGTARCVKFMCPLVNMNNSATLTVRARLWNSTMIEDYREAWSVSVQGQATLKLLTKKPTIKMVSDTIEFVVDVHPEQRDEFDTSAPLWIMVVSVLAGVLLLAVICLLLWKFGFFKRASTRELYEAQTQKAQMKSQPSQVEQLTKEL